ncbi:uncharacterized protein LOC128199229 [Bicyclus anynana]|uniref:Uncharacterized protein LOC128199229 n=1 Tax=Bicyclus anynana TaxID=110368 RepID=A0ABM3LXF7_BICAN|nr:uncharacterized protein LOC128199229 [Bicyclus anynana]
MKFIVVLAALVAATAALQPAPVIVEDNQAIDEEVPELINFPALPEADEPITVNVPGGPTVNIVINVNTEPQQFDEIEPTPIQFVDDEIEPTPVVVVDHNDEGSLVQVVDHVEDDFLPDPAVYY